MRIVAALCVLGVIGCNGGNQASTDAAIALDSPQRAVVSIAISGPTTLHAGEMAPFTAIGTYDDSTTADVTNQATWTSSLAAATTASNQIIGVSAGATVISATVGTVHADANLRVLSAHVLIATNYLANSITFFAPNATANTPPLRTISGALTTLDGPGGVFAIDEEVYVVNSSSVAVFPIGGSGNIAPTRSISGAATTIASGRGLTVFNSEIFIGGTVSLPLAVFPSNGTGNIAPTRTIGGGCGGCTGLAVVNNELYSNSKSSKTINVYAASASGAGAVPLRTITDTTLDPISMFVAGAEIYIGNLSDKTLRVYPASGTGATAATRTITGFTQPGQPTVFNNELYVADFGDSTIRVFPLNANGAAAPTRTINGGLTTLDGPLAVFMY
jgi:hypothetical protein